MNERDRLTKAELDAFKESALSHRAAPWNQRREMVATSMLHAVISAHDAETPFPLPETAAILAVSYADALIKVLDDRSNQ